MPTAPTAPLRPALVLIGLLLVAANLRVGITTVGPVLTELSADLALPSAAASALIGLPLIAFAAISPVAPVLANRIGLERALALALLVLAAGLVVRSLPGPGLLWVGTAALGCAIAVLNVVLPSVVKRDFPDRIGQVTGGYSAVQASFAAIAAGVAVPAAAATSLGWRLPLGMWAGLALIALGALAPQLRRVTHLDPTDAAAADQAIRAPLPAAPRSPWRSSTGWFVTAFMALQSLAYYVLITWLPAIEVDAGTDRATAGVHQLVLNGCGIGGSLLASALIPRLRDQRPIAVAGALGLLGSALGMLLAPGLGGVWAGLGGFSGGMSIVFSLSAFGLRTVDHRQAARLSGMAQSVGYVLAATGPFAFGLMHDATGSWRPALILLAALMVVLVGVAWAAGRDRVIR